MRGHGGRSRSAKVSRWGSSGCALVECACLDADLGDADPVRRSYLAGQPHDPGDPAMAELRARVERWIADPEREFMRGADVRGWLAWHGVAVEQLSAGELVRLAALLQVFEAHPDRGRHRAARRDLGRGRERRPPQAARDSVIMASVISRTREHQRKDRAGAVR